MCICKSYMPGHGAVDAYNSNLVRAAELQIELIYILDLYQKKKTTTTTTIKVWNKRHFVVFGH